MDRPTVDLRFVGHATVLVEIGGARVLTDPFLRTSLGPLERHGPVPEPGGLGDVDLVLISHAHPDHFDRASGAGPRWWSRPAWRRRPGDGRTGG